MPVKIDLVTDVEKGTVAQLDLFNMIKDFRTHVSLTTISPRETVIRTESIWFRATEMLELLGVPEETINQIHPKYNGFRIYLSVHPGNLKTAACAEDYRNHLSVAVLPTDQESDVFTDLVLLPGFKSGVGKFLGDCCGNMNPPPSSTINNENQKAEPDLTNE